MKVIGHQSSRFSAIKIVRPAYWSGVTILPLNRSSVVKRLSLPKLRGMGSRCSRLSCRGSNFQGKGQRRQGWLAFIDDEETRGFSEHTLRHGSESKQKAQPFSCMLLVSGSRPKGSQRDCPATPRSRNRSARRSPYVPSHSGSPITTQRCGHSRSARVPWACLYRNHAALPAYY